MNKRVIIILILMYNNCLHPLHISMNHLTRSFDNLSTVINTSAVVGQNSIINENAYAPNALSDIVIEGTNRFDKEQCNSSNRTLTLSLDVANPVCLYPSTINGVSFKDLLVPSINRINHQGTIIIMEFNIFTTDSEAYILDRLEEYFTKKRIKDNTFINVQGFYLQFYSSSSYNALYAMLCPKNDNGSCFEDFLELANFIDSPMRDIHRGAYKVYTKNLSDFTQSQRQVAQQLISNQALIKTNPLIKGTIRATIFDKKTANRALKVLATKEIFIVG